jgi:uncharacterized protein YhjY with autotransporter beta-barrel domain
LRLATPRQSAVDAGALRIVRLSDQSITAFANLRHDAAYVNGKLTIGRVDSANDKRWRSSVAVSGGYDFPIQKAWLVGPRASVQFHQALPTADNSRLFSIGARVASTDLYVKPFARVASVWASGSDTTSQDRRWFQVATGVQAKVADAWVLGASAQTDLARKDARTRSLLLSASRTF